MTRRRAGGEIGGEDRGEMCGTVERNGAKALNVENTKVRLIFGSLNVRHCRTHRRKMSKFTGPYESVKILVSAIGEDPICNEH